MHRKNKKSFHELSTGQARLIFHAKNNTADVKQTTTGHADFATRSAARENAEKTKDEAHIEEEK
jgi:hypothetical protein